MSTAQKDHSPDSLLAILEADGDSSHPAPSANNSRRAHLVLRSLVCADVCAVVAAFLLSHIASDRAAGWTEALLLLGLVPAWLILEYVHGMYRRDVGWVDHTTPDEFGRLLHVATIGTWLFWLGAWACGLGPSLVDAVLFWSFALAFTTLGRAAARALCRRRPAYRQRVVIVGAGTAGTLVATKLRNHSEYAIDIVGFVDDGDFREPPTRDRSPILGALSDLEEIVRSRHVDRAIFAFSYERDERLLDLALRLRRMSVQVDVVPRLFEMLSPEVDVHTIEGLPLVGLPPVSSSRHMRVKRVLDPALAAAGLVLLAPLIALIAALVKLDSRGPVFYRSLRVGADGTTFKLLKFRTMCHEAEGELDHLMCDDELREEYARTHKLRNDPRITRVGRFLRRTSLDEVPQVLNVMRGELSLVGPRPITTRESGFGQQVERAGGPWSGPRGYWQIPGLRPGLTGLWQINGRSAISYEERVRLDKLYAANWSLGLDLLIIAKTLRSLVTSSGAY